VEKSRTDGATPLFMASQEGHADVVKLLLAAGSDISKGISSGVTPLMVASEGGHVDIVQVFLDAKADLSLTINVNGKDYTALSLAKSHGHDDVVALLKKYGAFDFDF